MAKLLGMPRKEREKFGGLSADRADVILAGALVYRWLLRQADRDRLWISRYGVREGMFLRHFLPALHLFEDVRAFSVSNLFSGYSQPPAHTEQVRRLSRRLFDGLKPLHRLGAAEAGVRTGAGNRAPGALAEELVPAGSAGILPALSRPEGP